jgi:hypothetical protein
LYDQEEIGNGSGHHPSAAFCFGVIAFVALGFDATHADPMSLQSMYSKPRQNAISLNHAINMNKIHYR